MGLLDIFKKNKVKLTEEQLKRNMMWELWTEEKVESPYAELMTYQSEINNGGHVQYFLNIDNHGNVEKEISALKTILSKKLTNNLEKAHNAYLILEEKEDDKKAEEILEQCDNMFYENEEEINQALEEYASKIEL